jgi:hypothetical protein
MTAKLATIGGGDDLKSRVQTKKNPILLRPKNSLLLLLLSGYGIGTKGDDGGHGGQTTPLI